MLLGISSRFDLDALLKEHKVEKYTIEHFEHDLATIGELDRNPKSEPRA